MSHKEEDDKEQIEDKGEVGMLVMMMLGVMMMMIMVIMMMITVIMMMIIVMMMATMVFHMMTVGGICDCSC